MDITWGCQSRVSTIDEELAKVMFGAGCRSIQFGVESGNQTVLNSIKKGITLNQVEKAVMGAHKAGIPNIICTFMIGHPEDTRDTIQDTVDFALRLHDLGVYYNTVYSPDAPSGHGCISSCREIWYQDYSTMIGNVILFQE